VVKFGFLSPLARNNESQDGGQFVFLGYMSFFFQPHYGSILLVDSSLLAHYTTHVCGHRNNMGVALYV